MNTAIPALNRRQFLVGGALATAATALEVAGLSSVLPDRPAVADDTLAAIPDIQFDNAAFSAAPITVNGLRVAMPPVFTIYLTAQMLRRPFLADQAELTRTLATLEAAYPWGAANLMTFVAYGLPYFNRLNPITVRASVPRLRSNLNRFVLEEAVVSPTDVHRTNPGVSKVRFNVPVQIDRNDVLFTLRSDNQSFLQDVLAWFGGSNRLRGAAVRSPAFGGLLRFTSSRLMFVQRGLPRQVASQNRLPFAGFIQPDSPMWMGFADQQVDASGPPGVCTFVGNRSSRLTTSDPGDYFDNGAIQHLSHDILDMLQFFDMATATSPPGDDAIFAERVQYMFHSPAIDPGNADPVTDGGGPSFLPNQNRGPNYARQTAQGIGVEENEHRIGHLSALQRSSRASDGTPVHLRIDGPGFDDLDVPDGSSQAKLQFSVFVPTADFFATMRRNQASLDLQEEFDVEVEENGLERFLTATRRQNFLIPPRRHRAFPLVEIGG